MCSHIDCTLYPEQISQKCEYVNGKEKLENPEWMCSDQVYKRLFNGQPKSVVPVLVSYKKLELKQSSTTELCLMPMTWGKTSLPDCVKLENVEYSNSFKSGKRCAIIAEGFYQWQSPCSSSKQHYFFYQNPDGPKFGSKKHLLKLAGLFNITKAGDNVKYSCTILTRQPDSSMAWMDNRVPVILNNEKELKNWLNSEEIGCKEAIDGLPKYEECKEEFRLKYHTVNKTFIDCPGCSIDTFMQPSTSKKKRSATDDRWQKNSKTKRTKFFKFSK